MIRPGLVALQFLTRVPVAMDRAPTGAEMGASVVWYPLVGLLLGVALFGLQIVTAEMPAQIQAILLLVAWVGLTGGLHLDGLADTADGWAGGRGNRARTLEIMRDPRCGAMGVTAISSIVLAKYAALTTLLGSDLGDHRALLIVPLLGRTILLALFLTTPYARSAGTGLAISTHLPRGTAAAIAIGTLTCIALWMRGIGIWCVAAVLVVFLLVRASAMHRIQGTTGDVAGALVEVSEASVLITAAVVRASS